MDVPSPALVSHLRDTTRVASEVQWHPSVGSTNQVALDAASAGHPGGLLVGADIQTQGRGRRGRTWSAPPDTSLTFSLLLRPTLPAHLWPLLTLMAGTAVRRVAASRCPAADIGLKWPNDVLIEGQKAAGILVESVADAVVIGIGLNIDWRGVDRPDGVVATSLAEHAAAGPPDRATVLADLVLAVDSGYAAAMADPAGIVRQYVPHCHTLGRRVVAQGVDRATGTAVGLTPDGHLRIRTDTGPDIVVSAGEVEHLR